MKKMLCLALLLSTVNCLLSTDIKAQNNWQVLNTSTTNDLLSLQCFGTDTVFMYGENGIVLKSMNAGDTFEIKFNGTAAICMAGFFFGMDTGVVSTGSGNISRTTNGGSNWSNTGGCGCLINQICFSNSGIGLFGSLGGIYSSFDRGSSWTSNSTYITPAKIISLGDSVFIANFHKAIFKTTNAGTTWAIDTLLYTSNFSLTGFSFYNAINGYVISGDGHLFSTNDSGDSWSHVADLGLTTNNTQLVFIDSLNGFLVSGNSQKNIYRTTNGGFAWALDYTASEVIEKLEYDGKHVFACGQNGMALRKDVYPLGVNSITDEAQFCVYPNPVVSQLTVGSSQLKEFSISIFNVSGKEIYNSAKNLKSKIINLKSFASGIYFIRISDGKNFYSTSFVKQ